MIAFNQKLAKANSQAKTMALEKERQELQREVLRVSGLIRNSSHELKPPLKSGWPDYSADKAADLKRAADASQTELTSAEEARERAAKAHDEQIKDISPEAKKALLLTGARKEFFPALAECKAVSHIRGDLPAEPSKGGDLNH